MMTNEEKYLKEGASAEEFATEFQKWCIINNNVDTQTYYNEMTGFLNEPSIPTLTEDERVILRNIENYNFIGRDRENALYVSDKTGIHSFYIDGLFDSLFQFIKERRRI